MGGEEFEIVAADTDLHGAALLAGRFADELRHSLFHCRGVDIGITASFGVTAFNGPADSVEEMRRRADEALYQAKRAGRDRIESTDPRRCHVPAA